MISRPYPRIRERSPLAANSNAAFPIPVYTPGKLARIVTPEGSHMAINYATNNFIMEEHTGAAVPLFSNSEGVGRIPPFIQQSQIFAITREYLGI